MTVTRNPISVHPLSVPASSEVDFGAEINNVDVENMTALRGTVTSYDDEFAHIRDVFYHNNVVVLKNQSGLSPKAQYELTKLFDPAAKGYGHGKTFKNKKSILFSEARTVPHQPEVQIIGNGFIPVYEGLENIELSHPHHKHFHRSHVPDAEDIDYTRFYRWHLDAALYDLNPPRVTSLMAVSVPKGRRQTLRYDDGTGDELDVPLGTTAFASSYRMYNILSEEDKEFVRTSRVEYAPHPYIWMSPAKSRSDGLGLYCDSLELPYSELPAIDESKIQILPMVWKNPVTGKLALQIHPSAVRRIHLKDGTVIDDLEKVRKVVHDLQRPGISPRYIYPHDWEEGDLVLFNNHGVLHSVVGAFNKEEVRLFRQCNIAASEPPLGPDAVVA